MNTGSYFDRLDQLKDKYYIIDGHALDSLKKSDLSNISKETKITTWIMSLLILLLALSLFAAMIPFRLYADIKYMFVDFMRGMEKK